MTDKEKLKEIKKLADAMYYAAQYLTTDASRLHKAMDEYHQFIINEYHKEEPVSEKKCMFAKDSYTDEDRKILCDGCEEECKYAQREEPVNKDFELALAEMIDKAQKCVVEPWVVAAQWKDELIKLAKSEEPVSEELEDAAFDYAEACKYEGGEKLLCVEHFKAGAQWKEKQMMAKAVDATVHIEAGNYPYIPQIELYDYDKDVPLAKEGDKYKVILIKKE